MIKWHHLQVSLAKDQFQSYGWFSYKWPPDRSFLFIGHITKEGYFTCGDIFFRVKTLASFLPHVKSAHLTVVSHGEPWPVPTIRIFGTTIYDQPQVNDRWQYNALPRTKAYVDHTVSAWHKDELQSIDITPILRELHANGNLTPSTYFGIKIVPVSAGSKGGCTVYAYSPKHYNAPTVHISYFVDDPAPSEPPPDPGIPQPPNVPGLPPVFTPPPIPPNRALVLDEGIFWGLNRNHIVALTDEPCLMKLLWTDIAPEEHKKADLRRGRVFRWDKKYCFVSWHEILEENPEPGLYHDFCWPDWPEEAIRWWRYIFKFNGTWIKPNTAFYYAVYPGSSHYIIQEDPTIPVQIPDELNFDLLPCVGPALALYDPFTWGGMLPPEFELLFTEPFTWIDVPQPSWSLTFSEPWG